MSKEKEAKYIFPKIVEGKEDIVGMIAYCFYKLEKMDFIKNNEQVGTLLDKDKLEKFQEIKYDHISEYKTHAKKTLEEVIKMTVDDKNKEILKLNDELRIEKESIEQKKQEYETKKKDLKERESTLVVKEKKVKEREKTLKKSEDNLEKRNQICKVKGSSFWYGVGQSLVATAIWTGIAILIITSLKYDIIKYFTEPK